MSYPASIARGSLENIILTEGCENPHPNGSTTTRQPKPPHAQLSEPRHGIFGFETDRSRAIRSLQQEVGGVTVSWLVPRKLHPQKRGVSLVRQIEDDGARCAARVSQRRHGTVPCEHPEKRERTMDGRCNGTDAACSLIPMMQLNSSWRM